VNNNFVIFSSGYNCEKFVEKNIDSVKNQTYKNFKHIIVDDASSDNTYKKIISIDTFNEFIYSNILNKGWLENSVKYLSPNVEDGDIIVILDLDDWLYDNNVLEKINNIYNETNCWTTYGTALQTNTNKEIYSIGYPRITIQHRTFRNGPWYWQHLRTFKSFLWKNLKDKSLRGPDGNYGKGAYDRAIGYPILEMSPPDKILYIPDILMYYNRNNNLNLDKVNRKVQKELCSHFQSLPMYDILERIL